MLQARTVRPSRSHLWQTLRLVGACALGFAIAVTVGLQERYWALVTAIVVTQPMLADTLSAGRDRIAGTLVGAIVGFLVLWLVQHGAPKLFLFWMTLAPLALLIAIHPYLRLSAVTLVVVVLVPGEGPPFAKPFDRVTEILIGTLAAILIALVIRPYLWKPRPPSSENEAASH